MLKKLLRNKKGTAEIVGTALFLVILFFFFSNVFLFHDRLSREMDQVIADRTNSAVGLETTTGGSGIFAQCTRDPIFYGYGMCQRTGEHAYTPPPYKKYYGPPYGMVVSGSYTNTASQDGSCQVLGETGDNFTDTDKHIDVNDDYICLNGTYSFTVNVQNLRLLRAISVSVYGNASDAEGEGVDVYLYNVKSKVFEDTGLTILDNLAWYNVTLPNPERYISLPSGTVIVNYLSSNNGFYWDETSYLTMWIDCQVVSVGPIALSVSDVGGKDLRLERLWITDVGTDFHNYTDLTKDSNGHPMEVWIAAGSSIDIIFGSTVSFDNKTLTINYLPVAGKVSFKVLTNLGNMATTTFDFPP